MNAFEQLVKITQSNDQLMEELAINRGKIIKAQWYLNTPSADTAFGSVHLERLKQKRSAILTHLKVNRLEGLKLIGGTDAAQ